MVSSSCFRSIAIDDYAVAQLAKHLGKEGDYQLFMKRSKYYAHYFDSDSGFMRGKLADGSWRLPFDPSYSLHYGRRLCRRKCLAIYLVGTS